MTDSAPVFDSATFDTGYWPSANSPVAARFFITPDGGVDTVLFGTSELEWPSFAHRFADGSGGLAIMEGGLTIGAEVQLSIAGAYIGVVPLFAERAEFEDAVPVDGLLLPSDPNADPPSIEIGDAAVVSIPELQYAFTIVDGVDLVASVNVFPNFDVTISDATLSGATEEQLWYQPAADEWGDLAPDENRPGELGVVAEWSADLTAVLSLVIEVTISVDTPVGLFDLLQLPIPVDLTTFTERRAPEPQFLVHPLPVVSELPDRINFGEVTIGEEATETLSIVDLGNLMLEGQVTMVGDGQFAVAPSGIIALANSSDAVQLTFAPTEVGPAEAEVWVETNDPVQPLVKVRVLGVGVEERRGIFGGGDGVPPGAFCGCSSTSGGAPAWGLAALVAWAARRRRR